MAYREEDPSRAAEERAARSAEQDELIRTAEAVKRGAVWTPALRKLARGVVLALVGIAALGAIAYGGSRVRVYMKPCHGAWGRCIDEGHAEVCGEDDDGPGVAMRCKTPCNSTTLCEPVEDPAPGEACINACGGASSRPPEVQACTPDHRAVMSCVGCTGTWLIVQTCAAPSTCAPSGPSASCVSTRP